MTHQWDPRKWHSLKTISISLVFFRRNYRRKTGSIMSKMSKMHWACWINFRRVSMSIWNLTGISSERIECFMKISLSLSSRVDKFEYTGECIIFDLLNIQLYHGWVIDPQDTELRTIVDANASSYNQLVEKMIRQRQTDRDELLRESNVDRKSHRLTSLVESQPSFDTALERWETSRQHLKPFNSAHSVTESFLQVYWLNSSSMNIVRNWHITAFSGWIKQCVTISWRSFFATTISVPYGRIR